MVKIYLSMSQTERVPGSPTPLTRLFKSPYREWFEEKGHNPPFVTFEGGRWWIELPQDLAVEFTLRWL